MKHIIYGKKQRKTFSTLITLWTWPQTKTIPFHWWFCRLWKFIVYHSALHNSESEELKDIVKIAVDPECVLPNIGLERPKLLIFNGHDSHHHAELIECVRENSIILMEMPAQIKIKFFDRLTCISTVMLWIFNLLGGCKYKIYVGFREIWSVRELIKSYWEYNHYKQRTVLTLWFLWGKHLHPFSPLF